MSPSFVTSPTSIWRTSHLCAAILEAELLGRESIPCAAVVPSSKGHFMLLLDLPTWPRTISIVFCVTGVQSFSNIKNENWKEFRTGSLVKPFGPQFYRFRFPFSFRKHFQKQLISAWRHGDMQLLGGDMKTKCSETWRHPVETRRHRAETWRQKWIRAD